MVTALRDKSQRIGSLFARLGLLAAALQLVAACSTIKFYGQAVAGHIAIMKSRQPIQKLLDKQELTPALHAKLELVQEIRGFAGASLKLPVDGQYTSYVDLGRPYVVWNVFAAAEFSVTPVNWCFPVAGCVSYRGYFDESDAQEFAETLRGQGMDVYVGGVAAYSSLGWFADPVLSSFIGRADWQLAALLFHELAHQIVYVGGDTDFNESFATAVEIEGLNRWLSDRYSLPEQESIRQEVEEYRSRQQQFVALVRETADDLAQLYGQEHDQGELRRLKRQRLAQMQSDYSSLRKRWGGFAGYDQWFAAGPNNAQLATVTLYNRHLPFFQRLLAAHEGDMESFYKEVKKISRMSKQCREAFLLGSGTAPTF